MSAHQEDVRDMLAALGISDHARPYSPHEVVRREILPAIERLRAGCAEWKAQVQHLEAVVERSAHYAAVGREVQKRVNRGEVEGSYLDLRGVKIPRTEART